MRCIGAAEKALELAIKRGLARTAWIYTPPGYDKGKNYPVLYLLHGAGDIESGWTIIGRANNILDKTPIGTGSLIFKEIDSSGRYQFVANPEFFQGKPYMDGLTISAIVDQAAHAIHPRVFPDTALHFEYSTSKGVPASA